MPGERNFETDISEIQYAIEIRMDELRVQSPGIMRDDMYESVEPEPQELTDLRAMKTLTDHLMGKKNPWISTLVAKGKQRLVEAQKVVDRHSTLLSRHSELSENTQNEEDSGQARMTEEQ